ncbi:hypothetical protein GCM10007320_29680 [Pseudorhodoferax aquiterrae]|uniref:DUF2383 domain-containing protein n=1 Tax=Pseudorhodoferax aquiterrae TaxID=747304 RepID=A0ABQ3G2I0_9BURK|nr:PA2169 family four-helix-bundle protein [Pseudorhodoferax aquiterrae]GHC85026.1 hypothetical protein GCM10007320_29680 [Pseudorhodoferax aquiterrae]
MTNTTDPTLINNLAQATPVNVPARESTGATIVSSEAPSRDDVVDVLNDLLENARDGEYGFKTCADQVQTARAKELFASRAEGCRVAGEELIHLIRQYGGEPANGGTMYGAMHRGWVAVKGAVGADSELSILESCERGEDTAIARYRKALKSELPADVRAVVERQAEGAQKNHDQIRDLRNEARAKD